MRRTVSSWRPSEAAETPYQKARNAVEADGVLARARDERQEPVTTVTWSRARRPTIGWGARRSLHLEKHPVAAQSPTETALIDSCAGSGK